MMAFLALLALACFCSFSSAGPLSSGSLSWNIFRPPATNGPIVQTRNGTIQGLYNKPYNQDYFLAVPYAQAPIGNLRFRNPVSYNSTLSKFPATVYAPMCIGYGSDSSGQMQSEDCLYLNVIRPSGIKNNSNLPVAVWIHGGALMMGGTRDPRYNLSYIVDNSVKNGKPIIAVSIAYRLSAWGFLQSKEVSASGNTNIGLRDQRLALQWIQENIGAFGGDPKKVTIWGESAGAGSVGWQITAYNGRDDGLFRAAIMESGNPVSYNTYHNDTFYQLQYDTLVLLAGCALIKDSLNCLRYVPAGTLDSIIGGLNLLVSWQPIVDGDFIARWASRQLADGDFVHVPIISGANTDEGTAFSPIPVVSNLEFTKMLSDSTGTVSLPLDAVPAASDAYPAGDPEYQIPSLSDLANASVPTFLGSDWRRSAAFYGDAIFIANRRGACQTWAAAGVPAYCYRFNTRPNGIPAFIGVTHFQEVAFVFNNTRGVGYSTNPFEGMPVSYYQLAELMSRSWAAFVADLDPNSWPGRSANADQWPVYNVSEPQNIVWDANTTELAYAEPDTFRQEGIKWIWDNADLFQR